MHVTSWAGDYSSLHIAALYGGEEVVRELVIEYKSPVDCVSSDGSTPLHLAARKVIAV